MKYFLIIVAACVTTGSAFAQIPFQTADTNTGQIGLTITNYGTLGAPASISSKSGQNVSMRFPSATRTEHLFEAGIWVGGFIGGQLAVSTAAVTDPVGYSLGKAGFEFSAEGDVIENTNQTELDVSQQDIITRFSDRRTTVGNTRIQQHDTPLYADVKLESYNWDFPFTENFTIVKYEITNSTDVYDIATTWDSIYVGMYADIVVRTLNTTDAGGAYYNKNGIGYLDSLYTTYGFDAGSNDQQSLNTYGAMSLIGSEYRGDFYHPYNAEKLSREGKRVPKVSPSYWLFQSGTGVFRWPNGDDVNRYQKMVDDFVLDSTQAGDTKSIRERLRTDGQDAQGNYISFMSIGPFPEVEPGETITVYFAFSAALKPDEFQGISGKPVDTEASRVNLVNTINSIYTVFKGEDDNNNGVLDPGEDTDGNGQLDRYKFPTPPDNPNVRVELQAGKATIYWDRTAEASVDPVSGEQDFEGYRVYSSEIGDDLNPSPSLLREFDTPGNSLGFNTGFSEVELSQPVTFQDEPGVEYWYAYELNGLLSGWQYQVTVTAFDGGSEVLDVGSLESSRNRNAIRIFPGTPVNENFSGSSQENKVGVYPNPYRVNAAWDGVNEGERRINFYNLPARCEIRIYTLAGDIVAEMEHNSASYSGDTGWYDSFSDEPRIIAGGEHSWDLQSNANQILNTGLYLYTVKDLESGIVQTGKLAIIK